MITYTPNENHPILYKLFEKILIQSIGSDELKLKTLRDGVKHQLYRKETTAGSVGIVNI